MISPRLNLRYSRGYSCRKKPMNYQYIPNLWPSAIATAITISLMLYAWKNRKIRGALPFFFTMLLAMIWIVCQALSLAATDLSTKIMWANIYWLAIMYRTCNLSHSHYYLYRA